MANKTLTLTASLTVRYDVSDATPDVQKMEILVRDGIFRSIGSGLITLGHRHVVEDYAVDVQGCVD